MFSGLESLVFIAIAHDQGELDPFSAKIPLLTSPHFFWLSHDGTEI